MIIIGHPWIKSETFTPVSSLEEIKSSQTRNIVLLQRLKETHTLAAYCQENGIVYALEVDSVEDAMFANALGAKYMLCKEEDALVLQVLAQEYLFDTRILVPIKHVKEMAKLAKSSIDGVIFPAAIGS